MDDSLCNNGAQQPRPSAWKSCNQSPCPLLAMPEAHREAYYREIVSGPISEQLGLGDASEPSNTDEAATESRDLFDAASIHQPAGTKPSKK
eukprot:scaffold207077_cov50-Prasinocladus_malaysianus.AAC.1